MSINNPALKDGVCCFGKVFVSGFNTLLSAPRLARESVQKVLNPSHTINRRNDQYAALSTIRENPRESAAYLRLNCRNAKYGRGAGNFELTAYSRKLQPEQHAVQKCLSFPRWQSHCRYRERHEISSYYFSRCLLLYPGQGR